MKRRLMPLALRLLGYSLADVRAIEAARCLRQMPKGTFVCWHKEVGAFVCYVRTKDGYDIKPYGLQPHYHETREGAIFKAWEDYRRHCDYHGMKYGEAQP